LFSLATPQIYNGTGYCPDSLSVIRSPDVSVNPNSGFHIIDSGLNAGNRISPLDISVAPDKEWTFMAYMAADNNLSQAGLDDFNEMETAGSNNQVNVIALLDLQGKNTTNLYYVNKDQSSSPAVISQTVINSPFPPEINTGDPANLTAFVNWTIKHYPARHYALLLWGHGLGWKGIGYDDTSGNDSLNMEEIESALKAVSVSNNPPLDIVAFDACLMQMTEMATILAQNRIADYMVGSEESVPGPGWNYTKVLTALENDPKQSPVVFAADVVSQYIALYPDDKIALSALDLSGMKDVALYLNMLADNLMISGEWANIFQARNVTERFSEAANIDLYDFAVNVRSTIKNSTVHLTAVGLIDSLHDTIISNGHNSTHPEIRGLSVYFPADGSADSNYLRSNFYIERWNAFLPKYLNYTRSVTLP
jgi:hypothetical protein